MGFTNGGELLLLTMPVIIVTDVEHSLCKFGITLSRGKVLKYLFFIFLFIEENSEIMDYIITVF